MDIIRVSATVCCIPQISFRIGSINLDKRIIETIISITVRTIPTQFILASI